MKLIITFFALLGAFCINAQVNESSPTDSPPEYSEVVPEFPGGEAALIKYLLTVPYPDEAKQNDVQGEVMVRFVIDTDGSIIHVEVAKSSGSVLLDSVCIIHTQQMPHWKPGTQSGKPVKVQYVMPFRFSIKDIPQKAEPKKKKRKG